MSAAGSILSPFSSMAACEQSIRHHSRTMIAQLAAGLGTFYGSYRLYVWLHADPTALIAAGDYAFLGILAVFGCSFLLGAFQHLCQLNAAGRWFAEKDGRGRHGRARNTTPVPTCVGRDFSKF